MQENVGIPSITFKGFSPWECTSEVKEWQELKHLWSVSNLKASVEDVLTITRWLQPAKLFTSSA